MDNDRKKSFILENYRFAKSEIVSTIATQYKLLSILITATAAVFVYILDKTKNGSTQLIVCACLIIPGLYAFFGALWLDQVYRQRRLAIYIYRIEEQYLGEQDQDAVIGHLGWEHFVHLTDNDFKRVNTPSRFYYAICLGLFTFFPVTTAVLACVYRGENVLFVDHPLFLPAMVGIALWGCFILTLILYVIAISGLEKKLNFKPEAQENAPESDPAKE